MGMPDRIYVTFTPTTAPESYHTAIHYERTDDAGKVVDHQVIEAKPERYGQLSSMDNVFGVIEENIRQGNGPSRFGKIQAQVREANPDDASAPYEIIAEGPDLGQNFAKMRLFASGVNMAGFAYRGDRQNSNTFAGAALKAGELPSATGVAHDPAGPPGELLEFFAPGLNQPLKAATGRHSSYAPTDGIQHFSAGPPPNGTTGREPPLGHDLAAPNASPGWRGPAAPNMQLSTLPPGGFDPSPTGQPRTDISPLRHLSLPGLPNPPAPGGGYAPRPGLDPNGSLYGTQPLRQFENGTRPIGYISNANLTGTFDPSVSNNLNKTNTNQPGFVDGTDAAQRMAPQPASTAQNLTIRTLRMMGVPEANIAAAINDPAQMQGLLNQLYGRRSMTANGDNGDLINRAGRDLFRDRPDQESALNAPAQDSAPPFGWAGLAALPR
jgi:hypothetical protein